MASILNVDQIKTASGTAAKVDVHNYSVAIREEFNLSTSLLESSSNRY